MPMFPRSEQLIHQKGKKMKTKTHVQSGQSLVFSPAG